MGSKCSSSVSRIMELNNIVVIISGTYTLSRFEIVLTPELIALPSLTLSYQNITLIQGLWVLEDTYKLFFLHLKSLVFLFLELPLFPCVECITSLWTSLVISQVRVEWSGFYHFQFIIVITLGQSYMYRLWIESRLRDSVIAGLIHLLWRLQIPFTTFFFYATVVLLMVPTLGVSEYAACYLGCQSSICKTEIVCMGLKLLTLVAYCLTFSLLYMLIGDGILAQ